LTKKLSKMALTIHKLIQKKDGMTFIDNARTTLKSEYILMNEFTFNEVLEELKGQGFIVEKGLIIAPYNYSGPENNKTKLESLPPNMKIYPSLAKFL
jgi:hypothetical protein